MSAAVDEAVLDDVAALAAADRGDVLRALAGAGASVRTARRVAEEAGVRRVAADGRPRALLVAGAGGAAAVAELLAAVAGPTCPIPVLPVRGLTLPGWVGPLDLVAAVCSSGRAEETLAVADEAARRGARLVTVGPVRSPRAARAEQAARSGAAHLPVEPAGRGGTAPAQLWALAVPLLVLADALGLAPVPSGTLAAAADRLDAVAASCGPSVPVGENPAKAQALDLSGALPVVWGSGDVAGAAAYRFAAQLAAVAKVPAVWGTLPEVGRSAAALLDGPYAGAGTPDPDDFFRDRVEDPAGRARLRVLLLRDPVEDERVAVRRRALIAAAAARGVAVDETVAEGVSPLECLASLIARADFACVYLALGSGTDPTADGAVAEIEERVDR